MPSQALAVASLCAWLGYTWRRHFPERRRHTAPGAVPLPLAAYLGWPSELPAACLLGRRLPEL